jgi:hypothetical protein
MNAIAAPETIPPNLPAPTTLEDIFPTTKDAQGTIGAAVRHMRDVLKLDEEGISNALAGCLVSWIAANPARIDVVEDLIKRMVTGTVMLHIAITGDIPVTGDRPAESNTPEPEVPELVTFHNREDKNGWLRILVDGRVECGEAMQLDPLARDLFARLAEQVRDTPLMMLGVERADGDLVTQAPAMELLARLGWTIMRTSERLKLENITPEF